jgi:hypothetical protein
MNGSAVPMILAGAVSAAVVAALVAAVIVLGSPARQRQYRLDERRERDLAAIAGSIAMYASSHGTLPAGLDTLGGEPGTPPAPSDPESGAAYGYAVLASDTYQLCAEFTASSSDTPRSGVDGWTHRAGRQCFERKQAVKQAATSGAVGNMKR